MTVARPDLAETVPGGSYADLHHVRVGARFDLTSLLKRGNGIDTYLGVDATDGSPVVVKTIATAGMATAARLRLEHEARLLGNLDIGLVNRILWSGEEEGSYYVVQPHFEGETLADRLQRGRLSVASTLKVALDVLKVLVLVHQRGVLHRDIKPSNIIVTGGETVERAELIDFGLARSGHLHESMRDEPVGTVRYVAPEAAGLLKVPVDAPADLYSLGIVLFECLAGDPPFVGDSIGAVLRQHLNLEPPQLRSLGLAVPRSLDGVLQRLLAKDPGARYQSARAVRADLSAILIGLESGPDEPPFALGIHDQRHVLAEPSFIGRSSELSVLTDLLDRVGDSRGGLVMVEAESGAGKSRLLQELSIQGAQRDFWVLIGQGVDQEARHPFQVLEGLVAAITHAIDENPVLGDSLRLELGDWREAAIAALPALAQVLGRVDGTALGPEDYGETRSIDALSVLLDGLGRLDRPVLILLDDLQWADSMTIALLTKWHDGRERAKPTRVMIVSAFRSEDVDPGHPLRAVDPWATVTLAPFSPDEVESLCVSMAGPLPEEALSTIVHLADGNPFMASAVLRGMVEMGSLRYGDHGWEADALPAEDVQTSRRAALFLARRFEVLAPSARRLLTIGALLGKEFDLQLAISLSELGAPEVASAIEEARRRRILWVDISSDRCSFTHDKLRETLLDNVGPADRKSLHGQAAERIERDHPDRVFELAYHFDAAGQLRRALPYALLAAELARSRHALEVAVAHYRIAQRADSQPSGSQDRELTARISEGLGDVLTLQGHYSEATALFEQTISLTEDAIERANLKGKLGNIAFKRGDQANARIYLEGALEDLGRRVPRSTLGQAAAVLREVIVQALHTLAPRIFLARRTRDDAESEFAAIRIYSRLAYVYWFSAGKVPCAWSHLREMNLAERYGPSPELAQAYSSHAPVMTMIPWYARGLRYAERALAIRRELGDVWGQGQSLNFYGVVLYASSRYRECIEACRESVRLLERAGDRWEQNTATWHQVFSHYRLGELSTAQDMARELYYSSSAIGDITAAGAALSGWARSGLGQIPEAFLAIEMGRNLGDAQTSVEVHLADGLRLLYSGEIDQAVGQLREADDIAAKAGMRQEYVAPVKPWLATALRMQVEATNVQQPQERKRLLRSATQAARVADRLARSYGNNRPHALRERGQLAALRGRTARARRRYAQSLAVSEAQGADYESALTREAMAKLALTQKWTQASTGFSQASAQREEFEPERPKAPTATLSLADRFGVLLEVGRHIGTATSTAAILQEVHDAAVTLLRGDHCEVVLVDPAGGHSPPGETDLLDSEVSSAMMAQAIEERLPVVSGTLAAPDSSDGMLLSQLRSVLCAPIICEGDVVACFCVTHHQVNDLFGDVEIQLAEFIATLAGASLEHVAGSEAHFRSLAQNSSDVITIVDRQGVITYQSSSLTQVFGFGPDELVGRDLASWLHPDDADQLLRFLRSPDCDQDANTLVQVRMGHRDGTWRVGESAVRGLFDDPTVRGLVLNTRDASDRVALETELRDRALHDPLTGLANRTLFIERIDEALSQRQQHDQPLAVVFLDLDDFKLINDSLGHVVGDLLLERTAERLEMCVRPEDTVARFGGDEFALLLENADRSTAEIIVKRIIAQVERPYQILDHEVLSRASVGVAVSEGSETAEELVIGADVAMYVAKSRGKSRYEVFEPSMRDASVERLQLRTDLEWAALRDELVVHYQPIVDLPDCTVRGFEALVRWKHPSRGMLEPDQWIGLAEDSGMIVPVGAWVLHSACNEAVKWQRSRSRQLAIGVNVSARQLQGPELLSEIASALAESGLRPSSLILEITESATVEDTEGLIARLESFKALGVTLSIDDFGTGYSSLSYLRRLPVDFLKVDRSFVAELATNSEDLAIVSSVVNLAHSLGLQVVAEGVESDEQKQKLCDMGCDLAQGFRWQRPADSGHVNEWLDSLDPLLLQV
jgi:diguanylate cyclase (GGDEF)-like protein/PAS domain S-box-containing protein